MNKSIKFTKMQGLGNDFILLESEEYSKSGLDYQELAKLMCDRHFGVGADGLIIVNPPEIKSDYETNWRIFNSDGSEPQMCGNGIRCFAKYVYNKGLVSKKNFSVGTLAGEIIPEILDNGKVRVDMGKPELEPSKIPANIPDNINFPLEINGKTYNITAVSMGNPHCIIFTDEDTVSLAKTIGPEVEVHPVFPEKTNVEAVKILSKNKIKVDVWERGCGITLACGTGACASVVAAVLNGLTETNVEVELPGGNLFIEWDRSSNKVFMTGESAFVFEGEYFLYK